MQPNIAFGLLNLVSAGLIVAAGIPLVKGKIKRNGWYGVRIQKSLASDENWYKMNAYGGKQFILWSLVLVIAGLICFWVPFNEQNRDLLAMVLGVGPITVCLTGVVVSIYAYARRL